MLPRTIFLALVVALIGSCDDPTAPGAPIASVEVVLPSEALTLGTTAVARAIARDEEGNVVEGVHVHWSSSDTGVATVSGSGMVTPKSAGTVTITATAAGVGGSRSAAVPVPHYFLGPSLMRGAAGSQLPVVAFDDFVDANDPFHYRVVILEGRFDLAADGRYEHEYLKHEYLDGNGPFPSRVRDRGDCRVRADRVECVSSLIVNIAFSATWDGARLVAVRDLVGEGTMLPYDYSQMHVTAALAPVRVTR